MESSRSFDVETCLSRIIFRTPDGLVDEVINFLEELLENETNFRDSLLKALSKYNKTHVLTCYIKGLERPSLITNFNEVARDCFCDPYNHRLLKFDHQSKAVVSETLWEADEESESWRQAMETAFFAYVQRCFKGGHCGVFGVSRESSIAITVCIIKRQQNPKNYYSSCWRSVWTLVTTPGVPEGLLKGSVQVEGHYAERGSAFMTSEQTLDTKILLQDEHCTAGEVVKLVKDFEDRFHRSVLDGYLYISESVMKMFRRRKPISKSNMNWNIRVARASNSTYGNSFAENFATC